MKKALSYALALLTFLVAAPCSLAQEKAKPVLVASISSYDALRADVGAIGQLIGQNKLLGTLDAQIAQATGNKGLAGLDGARPWAVIVDLGQIVPAGLVYLPVTDLNALLKSLEPIVGPAKDAPGGLKQISAHGQNIVIKAVDGWAIVSNISTALENAAANPLDILGDLPKQYDVALQFNMQGVPPLYRDQAIDQLKAVLATTQARNRGESDDQYKARTKLLALQQQQMVAMIKDLDQFTLGWQFDGGKKEASLDFGLTMLAGSESAKQFAAMKPMPSKLGGFGSPASTVAYHMSYGVDAASAEYAQAQLATSTQAALSQAIASVPPEARELVQQFSDVLVEMAKDTLKEGHINAGFALNGQGPFSLVGGLYAADTSKLEALVKKVADQLKNQPGFPPIKLNAESHQGVNFHVIPIPAPPGPQGEQLKKFFGAGAVSLSLGFGPKGAYLAFGVDSPALLKKALDESAKTPADLPPIYFSAALAPLLKVAGASNPIVGQLGGSMPAGKDRVTISAKTVANGAIYRVTLDEGIVRAIGSAGALFGGLRGF